MECPRCGSLPVPVSPVMSATRACGANNRESDRILLRRGPRRSCRRLEPRARSPPWPAPHGVRRRSSRTVERSCRSRWRSNGFVRTPGAELDGSTALSISSRGQTSTRRGNRGLIHGIARIPRARDAWHAQVDEHQVGGTVPQLAHRVVAVGRRGDVEPLRQRDGADQRQDGPVTSRPAVGDGRGHGDFA